MKLRAKISIIVITLWCVVVTAAYLSSQFVFNKSYLKLEQKQANINIERTNEAVQQTISALNTLLSTWAIWDDAYQFASDLNKTFINANLVQGSLAAIDIDGIIFYDMSGKLLYSTATNSARTQTMQTPSDWLTILDPISKEISPKQGSIQGLASTSDGKILMIAGQPIMTSNNQGPAHGTIYFVKYLTHSVVEKIRDLTKLDLTIYHLPQIKDDSDLINAYKITQANKKTLLLRTNENSMTGYTPLLDTQNKVIALIKTVMPRIIYRIGVETVNYYNTVFIVYASLLMIALWYMLQTLLVRRLERLKQEIGNIDENNNNFNNLIGDVSDEIANVASLYHQATHDPLTGLANRTLLEQAFINNLALTKENRSKMAIIFIDLDHFKRINDTHGHKVGDQLLIKVAHNLQLCIREKDIAARFGGDEFVVMLIDVSLEQIKTITERLFNTFSKPMKIDDHELYVSTCLGISYYPDHGRTMSSILSNADMALYHAKENGRNSFEYYSDSLSNDILNAHSKEAELQHAMDNKELCLYYQPIFDVRTKRIISYEALIRWNNPQRGILNASEIIPLAEKTGLIVPIGQWVLLTACLQAKKWQAMGLGSIPVSVNISVLQTVNTSMHTLVLSALQESNLAPEMLELELTETSYVEITETILNDMQKLKEIGVKLVVDDFGVGYSGLGYLRSLPVSKLKIDRTFVMDALTNPDDNAITLAIIAIAHQLDLEVIAEGVETIAHFEFLRNNNVDAVQGNFLCKPLSASAFENYIDSTTVT